MEERVGAIRSAFQKDLKEVADSRAVENLRVKYLGKKGLIQDLMALLRETDADQRREAGKRINALKEEITALLQKAEEGYNELEQAQKLQEEIIDISLPGRRPFLGRRHPIQMVLREVIEILTGMGFSVQYGPEIDSDYYNFEGLNYPADHPAREMQDTFYITNHMLLRSQTSNVQLRVLESHTPPIRIISPGTVYRNENISSRSHVFFHQVEGLYVDEGVSFADLLATMRSFWSRLFKKDVETRFRPSFFPFVEPGLEVDIRCSSCEGAGCRLCKQTGWLEVAGAGMVHPEVLKNGGVDPNRYSGFAWGLGIERVAMLRYGIKDIRMFAENDLRFLQQFH